MVSRGLVNRRPGVGEHTLLAHKSSVRGSLIVVIIYTVINYIYCIYIVSIELYILNSVARAF